MSFTRAITPATRISLALVLVTVTVLMAATVTGLLPTHEDALAGGRNQLSAALAHQLANSADPGLPAIAHTMIESNPDIWSIAVHTMDGDLHFETAGHGTLWAQRPGGGDVPTHVELPMSRNGEARGAVQFRFAPSSADSRPYQIVRMLVFVALVAFLVYRIVLAYVMQNGGSEKEDLAAIAERNAKLERMVKQLDTIRKQVQEQNEELKLLATHDTLTSCYNRRAIFEQLDAMWNASRRYGHALSFIMLDIDHFKSVNDNHGHSTGDQVLAQVAKVLRSRTRKADVVGRYGGEEFCVLLPHTGIEQAAIVAENLRAAIAEAQTKVPVTASFGVACLDFGARDPQEFIDQADQALYISKNAGRDHVVRWDRLDDVEPPSETTPVASERSRRVPDDASISYHAVTALVSVLGQRDPDTAAHSQRVSELCSLTADGLMSARDRFILEVAALLHDIGKIGVPDAILLKPEPLTEEEWDVMRTHDRIGIESINTAFHSPELTNIVRHHQLHFAGRGAPPDAPVGHDIPLRARILSIADAFDSMISDRVYREGRKPEAAFAELRRCAGVQFDPELVERFIEVVTAHDAGRQPSQMTDSTDIRLQLGLAVERLVAALQANDLKSVTVMADRLRDVALKCRRPDVAEQAAKLAAAAEDGNELVDVLEASTELVSLCRAMQEETEEVAA